MSRHALVLPALGSLFTWFVACGGDATDAPVPAGGGQAGTAIAGTAGAGVGGSIAGSSGASGGTAGTAMAAGGASAGAAGKSGASGGSGAAGGTGGAGAAGAGSASAGAGGAAGTGGAGAKGGTSGAGGAGSGAGAGGAGAKGGTGGASGAGGNACPSWSACDDGDASTTGDICTLGACKGAAISEPFVVHEWGTFTSVKASDGHTLGGVHHVDEYLPGFVHRRTSDQNWAYALDGAPDEPLQQLETPVLYFHSNVPRAVQVDVSFPLGVVGEWYPDAAAFSPPLGPSAIAKGSMSWSVAIDPAIPASSFQPVSPEEIWAPSRNVACAPVRSPQNEREQFIFYRGLGKFDPPVTVAAPDDQTLHVANLAATPADHIPAAFLLVVDGTQGAFVPLGPLAPGHAIDTPIPAPTMSADELVAAAQKGLRGALVATGLFEDEAQAMVETWTRSWFKNQGLRILYMAPRPWTDGWLPTTITPTPTQMVRTLVGRVEVLRPSEEASVVAKLTEAFAKKESFFPATLGRFAEPRLFRAVEQITDPPGLRDWAESLRKTAHEDLGYP